ncbi:MAG: CoB--CoM heterodisulfide reductase iron-sulfur subunit B family protein [Proteobacteria bacterium]|nr:CoB--CoM heterodisulfide reductase iron-sulfur subunit B family protein [Pseudomonadota bacterium]
MISYPYFPGCALSTKAKALDISARETMKALGYELKEIEDWTCCGAVFPLAEDEHIRLVSPMRSIFKAGKDSDKLITLCSACFNVLRRTQRLVKENKVRRDRVFNYMEEEVPENFNDNVKVVHLIEIIRDEIGFDKLSERIKKPLTDLKVAPFYDCLTYRPPKEMEFEDPENPKIYTNLITALGGISIDFPFRSECCGAHLSVSDRSASLDCSYRILNSARLAGAEALLTSCPLCHYNLDARQQEMIDSKVGFKPIPVFYLTQIIGLSLGLDVESLGFEKNKVSPVNLLKEKGLL